MVNEILDNQTMIRLGFFSGILGLITIWEIIFPRRKLDSSKIVRWISNLGIIFINTLLLRLLFPLTTVALALKMQEMGWGLFNYLNISYPISIVASVILLDFVIYLQHVMFHSIPLLWLLHRVHHTDLDFDVTTGLRLHPIEILLSMGIKFAAVTLLGAPALAVLIFEVLLNATAMFNHGNIYIPIQVDQVLRWFLVTPDMHRIHHSIRVNETNSNFGFNLSWWDRLLGTYLQKSKQDQKNITIGIDLFREQKYLTLHWLIIQPFLNKKDRYTINHD